MEHVKDKILYVRADAGERIGTGHVMRCLALAQAWQDAGGRAIFITACHDEGLLARLKGELEVNILARQHPDSRDWESTRDIMSAHPGAWVVLDGYHFDETYQRGVKESGYRLLVIDDMAHLEHYYADIVLNQNLNAEQLHYCVEAYSSLLPGTRYALLRREFLSWKDRKRETPGMARRVLVTMGGSDPDNVTLKVVRALQEINISGLEATVVIGAGNRHAGTLEAAIGTNASIRLIRNPRNMPELMAWADLAISAAGSTVWEMAFMGLPAIVLTLADNQRHVAEALGSAGAALDLGWHAGVTSADISRALAQLLEAGEKRKEMTSRGHELVDGRGARRVVGAIQETTAHGIKLRQATPQDCHLLWEWANEPATRAASFDTEPIPWAKHEEWFQRRLDDPRCAIYIVTDEQAIPVGQTRFEMDPAGNAEISIAVAIGKRNKGYGSAALRLACKRVSREYGVKKVLAHIKEENETSISAFKSAGFANRGNREFKGHRSIEMVWKQEHDY